MINVSLFEILFPVSLSALIITDEKTEENTVLALFHCSMSPNIARLTNLLRYIILHCTITNI